MFTELSDLLVFAAVGRAGSFTRAGEALGLPKSTISRRITALEERLGQRLLVRSTRALSLTDAGAALLDRCQNLADEVDEALAFASELADEPAGSLRVTIPPNLGMWDEFARFSERFPAIDLYVEESTRFVDLTTERFDVAIRVGNLPDSSLIARPLPSGRTGVFASARYLAEHGEPDRPEDLAAHRFVVLQGRRRLDRYELERSGEPERVEVSLSSRLTVTTTGMLRELALRGAGLIIDHVHEVQAELRPEPLVRVLPQWSAEGDKLWLVTPSRSLLPRKTMVFLEHFAQAAEAAVGRRP